MDGWLGVFDDVGADIDLVVDFRGAGGFWGEMVKGKWGWPDKQVLNVLCFGSLGLYRMAAVGFLGTVFFDRILSGSILKAWTRKEIFDRGARILRNKQGFGYIIISDGLRIFSIVRGWPMTMLRARLGCCFFGFLLRRFGFAFLTSVFQVHMPCQFLTKRNAKLRGSQSST